MASGRAAPVGGADLRHDPVAARRGFVDAPHFNRLFRAEHGCTPGEFPRRR